MSATPAVTDFGGFTALKTKARNDDPEALRAVARQFEALFTQMMLKSMREASLGENLMDGEQSGLYRDLFDQQVALDLSSGRGLGLADMLVRQLTPSGRHPGESREPAPSKDNFVEKLLPLAQKAGAKLEVDPALIVAQSALETGWGKSLPAASENYFGIKARGDAPAVRSRTLEYADGVARSETAAFRAYETAAQGVDHYTRLIGESPRYAAVRGSGTDAARFGAALQAGGYATDPAYADKIRAIADDPQFQARIAAAQQRLALKA